jgi:hypothetical protein
LVGCEGAFGIDGIDGMLGKLGIEMEGIVEIACDVLSTMTNPTTPAMIRNTTAMPPKTTHGMPAEDFRGGGAHGVP